MEMVLRTGDKKIYKIIKLRKGVILPFLIKI